MKGKNNLVILFNYKTKQLFLIIVNKFIFKISKKFIENYNFHLGKNY